MRRRLLIVWLLLLALVGAIAVHEGTDLFAPEPAPARTGRVPMFDFGEPDLAQVEILYRGQSATLMRDPSGQWFQHQGEHQHTGAAESETAAAPGDAHVADPTRAAEIAQQLAVTARMLADRRVEPEQELKAYGLLDPQAMIAFYGRNGDRTDYARPLDVLYVGDLLPTDYAYYGMRDGDDQLSLIPRYQVALLLALAFGPDRAPTPLPVLQGSARD
jgi:hypothetical protein